MKEASQGREEPSPGNQRERLTEGGFSLMFWGALEYEEYSVILTRVKRADFHTPAPISTSPRMVGMEEGCKILGTCGSRQGGSSSPMEALQTRAPGVYLGKQKHFRARRGKGHKMVRRHPKGWGEALTLPTPGCRGPFSRGPHISSYP